MKVELSGSSAESCTSTASRILRLRDLCKLLSTSRSSVYNWINKQSAWHIPDFPKPIRIGNSAIGWLESDVVKYVQTRQQKGARHV